MTISTLAISLLLSSAPHWEPLFNGKNLEGWTIVNGDTSTWTVDNRGGTQMIVCSGKPTGVMRTDKVYENFILDFDWRHLEKNGNAGLFVWSAPYPAVGIPFTKAIEVQIMVGKELDWYTTHGDIFSIWGAQVTPDDPHPMGDHIQRCLPSERRTNPAPEWNHYTVTCIDGQINLSVNGKFVSGGYDITPRKGYICLEAEGTEAHFANIQIMELPPSAPAIEEVALEALATYRTLFTGINLDGWNSDETTDDHWSVGDNVLTTDGNGNSLENTYSFESYSLCIDYRCHDKDAKPFVIMNGKKQPLTTEHAGSFHRIHLEHSPDAPNNGKIALGSEKGRVDFTNIFIHEAD